MFRICEEIRLGFEKGGPGCSGNALGKVHYTMYTIKEHD